MPLRLSKTIKESSFKTWRIRLNSITSFNRNKRICYEGIWKVDWTGEGQKGSFLLNAGDLFSVPDHFGRSMECVGKNDGSLYSVINENSPKDPSWTN